MMGCASRASRILISIFLDLAMPDVHGLEVLKMLKAIEETRHIPVILFTFAAARRHRRGPGRRRERPCC